MTFLTCFSSKVKSYFEHFQNVAYEYLPTVYSDTLWIENTFYRVEETILSIMCAFTICWIHFPTARKLRVAFFEEKKIQKETERVRLLESILVNAFSERNWVS